MADSRTGQLSTFSLKSKNQFVCLFFQPDEIKDGKAKSTVLEEIKKCSKEERRHKEGYIVFDALSEKINSTKKEKGSSIEEVKNSSKKKKASSSNNPFFTGWPQLSQKRLSVLNHSETKQEEKDFLEHDLIPLPKPIVETIISPYLEEDSNTQLELLKHPQFFFMRNSFLCMSLLYHVVRGEQKESERIIEKYPELLSEKGIVTDYSGRKIEGTAFQIALGADDIDMCEMMEPYFDQLPDGQVRMLEQYLEQFSGDEEKCNESPSPDTRALIKVMGVIRSSKNDQECEIALEEFRNYLKFKKEIIKTGKHFNVNLMLRAFQLYDRVYNDLADDDNRRANLFWCKVIGYVQRFLPACYAQAFCYGFGYLAINPNFNLALNRGLKFQCEKDLVYFPLDLNPGIRLGYEYATVGGTCHGYWNKKHTTGHINIVDSNNGSLTDIVHISSLFERLDQMKYRRFGELLERLVKRLEMNPSSRSILADALCGLKRS